MLPRFDHVFETWVRSFAPLSMILQDGTARGTGNHAEGSGETPSRLRAVPLSKLPPGSSCLSHLNHDVAHRLDEPSPAVNRSGCRPGITGVKASPGGQAVRAPHQACLAPRQWCC